MHGVAKSRARLSDRTELGVHSINLRGMFCCPVAKSSPTLCDPVDKQAMLSRVLTLEIKRGGCCPLGADNLKL